MLAPFFTTLILTHKKGMSKMTIYSETYKGRPRYRFRETYKDNLGNTKRYNSKWYDSNRECKADQKRFLSGVYQPQIENITFERVAKEYFEFVKPKNTPKTIKEKYMFLDKYYEPIRTSKITDVTPFMIKEIYSSDNFKRLSTSRKNRINGVLKSIFNYAKVFYNLQTDPTTPFYFQKTEAEKMKTKIYYTPQQFNCFLEAIPERNTEYKNMYFFLYWTGMRLNECCSITFNDVLPDRINLYRQFVNDEWVSLKTEGSARNVIIDSDLYEIVLEQKEKYSDFPGFDKSWFVFGGYRQLPNTSIHRIANTAMDDAGLPRTNLHTFRHSYGSNLLDAGVDMYVVSKQLGHSSIATTIDIYAHRLDSSSDKIRNALRKK